MVIRLKNNCITKRGNDVYQVIIIISKRITMSDNGFVKNEIIAT